MRRARKNTSNKGFSLIELSIVIVIVGIMLAGALNMGIATANSAKITDTKNKLENISKALQLYYETNGDLPCPANGNATGANLGVEDCPPNVSGSGMHVGVVPTRTLNLPEGYMFDGWGNRISYFVDDDCDNGDNWGSTTIGTHCPSGSATTAIDVNDLSGTRVSDTAAYVLISHGKNGQGAYNRTGARNATVTAGTEEESNANATAVATTTYVDGMINDGNVAASYFDDIVKWQTDDMMYYCKNNEC